MQTQPVRYAPQHRRVWRRFRRWCTCGLRWPCPDRYTARAVVSAPQWSAPTDVYPFVGQAPNLTPAARWRANGGRW